MVCPRCKAQVPQGASHCPKCGAKFTRGVYCPHCRAVIPASSPKCPQCGKPLRQAGTAPPASKGKEKKPLTKRWWFWGICGLLVLGILGNIGQALSGGGDTDSISSSTTSAPETGLPVSESMVTPAPSSTPLNLLLAANVHVNDVMNGTKTEKIGQRAHINMRKSDATAASMEEFTAFVQEKVRDSGYNWWSILFEDGTGICFPASSSSAASYGEVDEEGCITQVEGDIFLASGTKGYTYAQRTPAPEPTPTPASTPTASSASAAQSQASSDTSGKATESPSNASSSRETASENGGNADNFNAHDNPDQQQTSAKYVLNTSSMKFHYPSCKDVKKIAEKNYSTFDGTREEAVVDGYSPCGHCKP